MLAIVLADAEDVAFGRGIGRSNLTCDNGMSGPDVFAAAFPAMMSRTEVTPSTTVSVALPSSTTPTLVFPSSTNVASFMTRSRSDSVVSLGYSTSPIFLTAAIRRALSASKKRVNSAWSISSRRAAGGFESLDDFGSLHRLPHAIAQFRYDRIRTPLRREQASPDVEFDVGIAEFLEGRKIGKLGMRSAPQLASTRSLPSSTCGLAERPVPKPAPEQCPTAARSMRGAAPRNGTCSSLMPADAGKHFHCDVQRAVGAGRSIRNFSRTRLWRLRRNPSAFSTARMPARRAGSGRRECGRPA